MRPSRTALVLAVAACVGAAVVIACTYAVPGVVPAVGGDSSVGQGPDGAVPDAQPTVDGTIGADVQRRDAPFAAETAPALPSFCQGILFYAPMDGTLTGTPPYAPLVYDGGPATGQFGPGKFGQAALFAIPNVEAFYPVMGTGTQASIYQVPSGSVAMWIEPQGWTLPSSTVRVFFKGAADLGSSLDVAPSGGLDTSGLVTTVDEPGGNRVQAILGPDASASFQPGGFNHVVSTWDEDAGLLSVTLNGGAMGGSGTLTSGWTPSVVAAPYLRLGGLSDPADAWLDEVVVWSRALSPQEIAAVYALQAPVGVTCGLP